MAETTYPVDAAAARAARLAAIEARLNPPKEEEEAREPGSSESPAPPVSGNGSRDNGLGAKRSAREEAEKKRELARTLQRTIVRDSGYAQAAGCVEVSPASAWRDASFLISWEGALTPDTAQDRDQHYYKR